MKLMAEMQAVRAQSKAGSLSMEERHRQAEALALRFAAAMGLDDEEPDEDAEEAAGAVADTVSS